MHIVIIALTLIAAVLLIGIVLIQKSKGGGLSSQFGGAGSVMGVRQTNSFLEKATWTLVGALAVLSVISSYTAGDTRNSRQLRTVPQEQTAPASTIPAPGQTAAPVVVEDQEAVPVEVAPVAAEAESAE